jgi:isocitrate dehydrogenase (NAD+)
MNRVTLIPGDGIGPEVVDAALKVLERTDADLDFERVAAGAEILETEGTPLPDSVLESISRNRVALKGPITTPVGSGFRSVNVELRKRLDLYANVRPALSFQGASPRYRDIDLVVIRENTEGLYSGVERMVDEDHAESVRIITRPGSERVVRFAFKYALKHGRRKLTAVHKANIMKLTGGLFLESARKVAKEFPDVEYEERIVDNMAMQLVVKPHIYDVIVTTNLFGDVLSDLCAGLVGGLGLAPSGNIGDDCAVFEPVHGSAPKYAGKNKVNPTATILSAALMLDHLGMDRESSRIISAVSEVIAKGEDVTYDLGGTAGTREMAEAIASLV